MERLTHDGVVHRIEPQGLAGVAADQRDDAMLERLRALGFRDLGVVVAHVIDEAPDDEEPHDEEMPGEQPDRPALSVPVPDGPLDLLGMVEEPGPLVIPSVLLVAGNDPTVLGSVEHHKGHTWLALYSLFEDGTIVRTVSRPYAVHAEHLEEIAGTFPFARPASMKALLVKATATSEASPLIDRPRVGSLTEVYNDDMAPAALLQRHRARVAQVGAGKELAALDDLTLVVALFRRSMHITFSQMDRARLIADTVQTVAGWCIWLALVLVLHPLLASVIKTVLVAGAIRFTGTAGWRFFVGDSGRPVVVFGLLGLGMSLAWGLDPLRWGVLVLLSGAGEAWRVLAWLALGGGPLSDLVVRQLRQPAPVPARQLQFAYRD